MQRSWTPARELTPPPRRITGGGRPRATVSVVVPTLNEERNVGWVLERMPPAVTEVIVVDGRSMDGTVAAARRACPGAIILREPAPGKGAALRRGFAEARGDYIVMIDADGSMDPAEIDRYVDALGEGYDLVKGSRFLAAGGTSDISRLRMYGNFGLLKLANLLYEVQFTELCYGFMAFRRTVLPQLRLTAPGFEIESQIVLHALRAGLRIAEVPSFEAVRRSGESNLRTWRDGGRVLSTLLRTRRARWVEAGGGRGLALEPTPPLVLSSADDTCSGVGNG
jgi:cellulose synthase/poly-beta-1,6-N-acetylglucosamine synthase-like glycosyltransferase